MVRQTVSLLPLLVLVACGYSEEKYADDYTAAMCDNLTACEADVVAAYVALGVDEATAQATFDTTYTATCEAEATDDTGGGEDTCDYDAAAAKECVDGVKEMSCAFWSTGLGLPAACATVCG